jgi:hypothetical protein
MNEQETVTITPKGILASMLIFECGMSMNSADEFCKRFVTKIQNQANLNEIRGVACLVLEDGWHIIGATKHV